MADIIELMKKIGLTPNERGVCLGLAYMAAMAYLIDDEREHQKHMERCSIIQELDLDDENILENIPTNQRLELQIFLENVQLIQSHSSYKHLIPLKQSHHSKYQDIVHLTQSIALEEQGNAKELTAFTGVYNYSELYCYLQSFKIICDQHKNLPRISLLIGSSLHMIMIAYHAKSQNWYIHNYGNTQRTDKTLAASSHIAKALYLYNFKAIITRIYSTDKFHSAATEIIKKWQQTMSFKQLHEVTAWKAASVDDHRTSWIHLACGTPNTKLIKQLIKAGANPDLWSYFGYSPIHTAIISNNTNSVRQLIKGGANLFQLTASRKTALHLAVKNEHIECIQLILSAESRTVFNILQTRELNLDLPSGICDFTIRQLALMLACKIFNTEIFQTLYRQIDKKSLPIIYDKVTRFYTNPQLKKQWLCTETLKYELQAGAHADIPSILYSLNYAKLSAPSGIAFLNLGEQTLAMACIRQDNELYRAIYPHIEESQLSSTINKVMATLRFPDIAKRWLFREMIMDKLKLDSRYFPASSGYSLFQKPREAVEHQSMPSKHKAKFIELELIAASSQGAKF